MEINTTAAVYSFQVAIFPFLQCIATQQRNNFMS